MTGPQLVSKVTVQTILAVGLTATVCILALRGDLSGEQFIGLALLPLAWAFRNSEPK